MEKVLDIVVRYRMLLSKSRAVHGVCDATSLLIRELRGITSCIGYMCRGQNASRGGSLRAERASRNRADETGRSHLHELS